MSYTLRQAKPLLTKPELELFQASRAGALKDIAPSRLAGKIQRARALRDKYRDVYQRQTVQTRTGDPKTRTPLGGENTRTQTKGEIMDEVLKRFEAQQAKQSATPPAAARAPKAKPATTRKAAEPRASARAKPKPAAAGADLPMRGASDSTPRQRARKTRAVQTAGEAVVQARSKKTRSAAPARTAKSPAKKAAKKAEISTSALASGVKRLQNIVKAVRKAVAAGSDVDNAKPRAKARPAKAPSDRASSSSSAPTDITPKAERTDPLKAQPVNKKIHASARSRTRAVQAKRDAR